MVLIVFLQLGVSALALDRIAQIEFKSSVVGFMVDATTEHVIVMTADNEIVVMNDKAQIETSYKPSHRVESVVYIPKLQALGINTEKGVEIYPANKTAPVFKSVKTPKYIYAGNQNLLLSENEVEHQVFDLAGLSKKAAIKGTVFYRNMNPFIFDGDKLLSYYGNRLVLWNPQNGEMLGKSGSFSLEEHDFGPMGKWFLNCPEESNECSIFRVAQTLSEVRIQGYSFLEIDSFGEKNVAFGKDQVAALLNGKEVRVYDNLSAEVKFNTQFPTTVDSVFFDAEGDHVAIISDNKGIAFIYQLSDGKLSSKINIDYTEEAGGYYGKFRGNYIALENRKAFQIWNIHTGQLAGEVPGFTGQEQVYFSPQKEYTVIGKPTGKVLLVRSSDAKILHEFTTQDNGDLRFEFNSLMNKFYLLESGTRMTVWKL